jgi:glycosyltransferase involved in cell wall biosynthesis
MRRYWSPSQKQTHFFVICRAEPENQTHKVIKAFLESGAPGTLEVVASSRYTNEYAQDLFKLAGQSSLIQLKTGLWNQSELCYRYQTISAVIHGHSVGGTNPSLVLALCHGTPVLAHDNPYNREVAGSMARYWKDEAGLTKLLDEFDPMTWPYDQAAVDDFNRRYNWDDVVEKYRQLLGL